LKHRKQTKSSITIVEADVVDSSQVASTG